MHKNQPNLFAAIHVGSEQVSLQIAEYRDLETIRILENIHRQISLGEETFQTGRIGTDTVAELCDILKGFRRKLTEYGARDYRLMPLLPFAKPPISLILSTKFKLKPA